MKSVLISIQPKWVEKIASGQKTIEVRKTRPKIETPFKCYIYCTIGNYIIPSNLQCGKVIGEFVCDNIYPIKNQYSGFIIANSTQGETNEIARQSCLDYDDMVSYLRNKDGYGWHISDLVIYDKPKELSEFRKLKERIERTCGCLSNNGLCNAARYEELCDNIKKCCFKEPNAPQSWCYVEELEEENK